MRNVQAVLAKLAVPLAVITCLIVSGTIVFNYLHFDKIGNDFSVYLRTAGAPEADAYGFPGEFPFPYMPTMLFMLKAIVEPLLFVPGPVLLVGFVCVSVLLYIRALRDYVPMPAILLCLIAPAILRGALTGQVSILLAAIAIWGMNQKDADLKGLAFGFIALVKPQLVIMAPLFFILEKDWKAVAWFVVTLAVGLGITLAAYGFEPWYDWIAAMPKFHQAVMAISAGGIGTSPALMAEHYGLSPIPFIAVGVALGVAVTVFAKRGDALQNAAIVSLGSLLAAPYSLAYDLAVILPVVAMMVLRGNLIAGLAMGTPFTIIPLGVATWGLTNSIRLARPSFSQPDQARS